MILLRGQKLSDDDLLAFSRRFGELDPPPNQERGRISPPGYPDIYVVSNVLDAKGDPIGALGAGEAVWHTDMSYLDTPPDASMLYSLEIPPSGGNTWFCGMQAACDALPADLRAPDRGPAHQARRHLQFRRLPAQGRDADRRSHGGARRLASGDPAPSRPTAAPRSISGGGATPTSRAIRASESDALLEELWAHVTQPRFVYEHVWKLGDLVMWDNRSTMHRRDPFDGDGAAHHASHPDQGNDEARGLRGLNQQEQSEETCGGRRSSMPGATPTRT